MKKNFLSLFLAIAMMSIVFTGCSKEDDLLGISLKVGTFNIGHGENWETRLTTGESIIDIDAVIETVQEMDVDILGLQEVLQDDEKTGQAQEIADALGWNCLFVPALDDYKVGGFPDKMYGVALISKYPISSYETFPIFATDEDKALIAWGGPYAEDRVVIVAEIDVDGNPVTVITTHAGLTDNERNGFLQVVSDTLETSDNPVILMGDLNMEPAEEGIQKISESFKNTADVNPDVTYTFPGEENGERLFIDYVFAPKNSKITSFNVINKQTSDHLPVIAEFEF